jgi:hypothetical protein
LTCLKKSRGFSEKHGDILVLGIVDGFNYSHPHIQIVHARQKHPPSSLMMHLMIVWWVKIQDVLRTGEGLGMSISW